MVNIFMEKLRFISLFAGIGGFDLGFERAGMQCVAQVEKQKKSLRTLSYHWPDVPKFDDVCTVGKHNLPECDVICGGFPCQDLSIAGKRQGLSGARSSLFYEMIRITAEMLPKIVVFENVPWLLSGHDKDDYQYGVCLHCGFSRWGRVHNYRSGKEESELQHLCLHRDDRASQVDITSTGEHLWRGGEVEQEEHGDMGQCLHVACVRGICEESACGHCGVPEDQVEAGTIGDLSSRRNRAGVEKGGAFLDNGIARESLGGQDGNFRLESKGAGAQLDSAGEGISTDCPHCGGYGFSAQTPRTIQSGWMGTIFGQFSRIGYCGGWTCLDARFFGVAQRRRRVFGVFVRRDIAEMGRYVGNEEFPDRAGVPSVAGKILSFPNRLRWNPAAGRSSGKENRPSIAGCLKTSNPTRDASCVNNNHLVFQKQGGFGVRSWGDGVSPTLLSESGTHKGGPEKTPMIIDVFPLVTPIAFSHSDNGRDSTVNLSPTLRASNNANSNQHGNGHLSVVNVQKKVRRITPVECERLQGFPDDWTKINSDSTRYSQLGNAVAVPVVEWIGEGIVSVMEQIYK